MARKPKSEAEKAETASEAKDVKFKRLAKARVNAAIGKIGLLRALANRNSYDYTEEQVQRMFATIRKTMDEVETAYHASKTEKPTFDF